MRSLTSIGLTENLLQKLAYIGQGILGTLERKVGSKDVRHSLPDVQFCDSARNINPAREASGIVQQDLVFTNVEQNRR